MRLFERAAIVWRAALLLLAASLMLAPATAQTFPKFTGLVVDAANVLPPETKAALTQKLEALQKNTKRQLVVATIPDLQGYPLDEYGYKLGRTWGVGLRDVNNGVILFIAPNEPAGHRGPRIEVGRGLEPIITDALSSVIIQQEMMPKLKAGDVPGAMIAGTDALAQQLRASPEEQQARLDAAAKQFDQIHQRSAERRSGGGGVPFGLIIWAVILLFVLVPLIIGRRRSAGPWGRRYDDGGGSALPIVLWGIANEIGRSSGDRGGGWGGGGASGGSDGSWGGGGFTGGGGGDFGGGGASGDW